MRKTLTMIIATVAMTAAVLAPTTANAHDLEVPSGPQPAHSPEITATGNLAARVVDATVDAPVLARPSGTGQYEYICIMPNGNSWSLAVGQATTDCKGSYMHKYLDGRLIETYSLAPQPAVDVDPVWAAGCMLAVAGGVALFVFPPTNTIGWITLSSLSAAGLAISCIA